MIGGLSFHMKISQGKTETSYTITIDSVMLYITLA